ncbi:MAG TPA: ribosome maturation factor RimM [Kofleriaceae bacterium]
MSKIAPGGEVAGRIEIGGVARAHGIRGEIVVVTHDPDSKILAGATEIFVGGIAHPIASVRDTPRGWLVLLADIPTRTAAEGLRGLPVEVDRDLIQMDEGDVLLADLVGCRVVLPDGRAWGTIAAVDLGVQDLLVIHDGDRERLLPLVDEFVTGIDLEARVVTVDPPEGLPDAPL